MVLEGQAIAKAPGSDKVVFVPYAAPGDELEIQIKESKTQYSSGRILKILEPGTGRADPPCPHHFAIREHQKLNIPVPNPLKWCGGCDWQHLEYPRQLELKRGMVQDALERIGKIRAARSEEKPLVLPVLASPQAWRYRNKVQVPFSFEGREIHAGFYHPGTHEITDFKDCIVQPEISVRIVHEVKSLCRKYGVKSLRHLFLRTNQNGEVLAAFVTKTPHVPRLQELAFELKNKFPQIAGLHQNVQPKETSVILGPLWRKIWGKETLREKIGSLLIEASPGAFLQVNTPACEVLYRTVGGFIPKAARSGLLLDLYSGVGSIALWLAAEFPDCRVTGVEENRRAVQDAVRNAELNRISNVRFLCRKAEDFLLQLAPRGRSSVREGPPVTVVLDPPRSGLHPRALEALLRLASSRLAAVVYLSCNPATFARDAGALSQSGLRLREVQPVDLFPQTSHVETVGIFSR